MKLAVVLLTFNEEMHLARALNSIAGLASEVFVIDSFSTDSTVQIARSLGATVLQNPFVNYSKQFRWGLENAPITAEWICRLDADEYFEPDLTKRLREQLPTLPAEVTGVNLKRKHIFMGRWIRHGGRYPLLLLRVWRKGKAEIEDRWMDEHIALTSGVSVTIDGGFCDHNLKNLTYFVEKHNNYASREAVEILNQKYNLFAEWGAGQQLNRQAAFKRRLKNNIYNRISFSFGPLIYFIVRYIFQLGFLDGKEGLIYHFLQGYWYRFLVGAKAEEYDRVLRTLPDSDSRLKALTGLSGLKLIDTP
jgi:glycosyltransferase involved in cell wall biosynthesis